MQPIGAFRQVKGCRQITQLRIRKRDFLNPVLAWIKLFHRHTIIKGVDGDIFFQMACNFVHKGNDSGIEFVFNGKHIGEHTGAARAAQLSDAAKGCERGTNMRLVIGVLVMLASAGCTLEAPPPDRAAKPPGRQAPGGQVSGRDFNRVVARVEPVAERICQRKAPRVNCNYLIAVDRDKSQPANAYQTVDKTGRPKIVFTAALIADARNEDEIAFILGHEAAHHIEGHLARTQTSAMAGAVLGGVLASVAGVDPSLVGTAQDLGATVGARSFSKGYELEADALGTIIAFRAGYDPLNGAAYFNRIADPGNSFLGTHPPNASRIDTVRKTLKRIQ